MDGILSGAGEEGCNISGDGIAQRHRVEKSRAYLWYNIKLERHLKAY